MMLLDPLCVFLFHAHTGGAHRVWRVSSCCEERRRVGEVPINETLFITHSFKKNNALRRRMMTWKQRLVHYLSPVLSWLMSEDTHGAKVQCLLFIGKWLKRVVSREFQARANGSCKWRESRNSEALTSTVSQQINVIVSTTADAIVVAVATFHRRVEFVRWRAQHTLKLVFLGSRWSPFYPALEDAAIKIRFTASRWDFHTSTYFTLPRGSDSRRLAVSRRPIGRLSFPHSSQDLFMGFLFTQFTTLQRARRSPRTTWKLASMSGGFWRNPKEESQAMKYCLVNVFGFEKREWMMLVNMIFEFLTRQKHCWWKPFDTCDGEGVFKYCLPT